MTKDFLHIQCFRSLIPLYEKCLFIQILRLQYWVLNVRCCCPCYLCLPFYSIPTFQPPASQFWYKIVLQRPVSVPTKSPANPKICPLLEAEGVGKQWYSCKIPDFWPTLFLVQLLATRTQGRWISAFLPGHRVFQMCVYLRFFMYRYSIKLKGFCDEGGLLV